MLTCTNWVSLNHLLVTWPATNHEPHCQHIPINKIWRWTESTPCSRWWCSHMVGIYSDCSTHSKLCDPSRTVCILQDQQQVRVIWREATSPHARIVPTFAARNCFVWMCQHQAKPRSTKTACGKCVTFNRWRAVVSATWKYDDPRLNMSHEGAARVWHVQPRVVIFPCRTNYLVSYVLSSDQLQESWIICKLKSFLPLYLHDLNTQDRRVIFSVSKTLCDFGHKKFFYRRIN